MQIASHDWNVHGVHVGCTLRCAAADQIAPIARNLLDHRRARSRENFEIVLSVPVPESTRGSLFFWRKAISCVQPLTGFLIPTPERYALCLLFVPTHSIIIRQKLIAYLSPDLFTHYIYVHLDNLL